MRSWIAPIEGLAAVVTIAQLRSGGAPGPVDVSDHSPAIANGCPSRRAIQ
jgi:hypothetical protein